MQIIILLCKYFRFPPLPVFLFWQTDFHLHCKEWDELLKSGDWEPQIIVEKLPAFFRFVKKVQGLVARELKETELARTSKKKDLIIYLNKINN